MDYDKFDLYKLYIDAPETQVLDINTDEHALFVSRFCHLKLKINFLLNNTSGIRNRINKANKAM